MLDEQHEAVFGRPRRRDDRSVHHRHHLLVACGGERRSVPVVDRAEFFGDDAFDRRIEFHRAAQVLARRVRIVQTINAARGLHLPAQQRVLDDGRRRVRVFFRQ